MQLGFSAEGLTTDSSLNQWHNKVELHAARKAAIVTAAKAVAPNRYLRRNTKWP